MLSQQNIKNIIDNFARREKPPAVVVDEAQHLTISALEAVRELYDRAGCGIVLAGSHDLFEKFLKSRAQLEQWLAGRIYEPLFLYQSQGLEVYKVYAKQ